MGNYQEHLKKINPLREVDSGSVRTQLFGNPFKLERPTDNKVPHLLVAWFYMHFALYILVKAPVRVHYGKYCTRGVSRG